MNRIVSSEKGNKNKTVIMHLRQPEKVPEIFCGIKKLCLMGIGPVNAGDGSGESAQRLQSPAIPGCQVAMPADLWIAAGWVYKRLPGKGACLADRRANSYGFQDWLSPDDCRISIGDRDNYCQWHGR